MSRTFGENLRRARVRAGLTQEALTARLGLKRQAPISLWESRSTLPKPETIVRLARAVGCKPRDLLEGVETPYDRLRAGKSLLATDDVRLERYTGGSKRASSA